MSFNKLFLLAISSMFFLSSATAQYYEIGGTMGVSGFSGDVSGFGASPSLVKPVLGIWGRYNHSPLFSARAGVTRAELVGNDDLANFTKIKDRNLHFRTEVLELSLIGEFNLSKLNIAAKKSTAPYLFAGISGFYYNPQAQMRGSWYDLRDLGTEGQLMNGKNEAYSKFDFAIPFGAGFKLNINPKMNLGLEFGFRKTFTDFLDDTSGDYPDIFALRAKSPAAAALSYRTGELSSEPISNPVGQARGNKAGNDNFFFLNLNISVNLTDKYGLDFDKQYDIFKQLEEKDMTIEQKREARAKIIKAKKKAQKKARKENVKRLKRHKARVDGTKKLEQPTGKESIKSSRPAENSPEH